MSECEASLENILSSRTVRAPWRSCSEGRRVVSDSGLAHACWSEAGGPGYKGDQRGERERERRDRGGGNGW